MIKQDILEQNYDIQLLSDEDTLKEVQRFKYSVYYPMGWQLEYDHDNKRLIEVFDHQALILVAKIDSDIIGTVSAIPIGVSGFIETHSLFDYFNVHDKVSGQNAFYTFRLIVDEKYRNGSISFELLSILYRLAQENNVRFNFLEIADISQTVKYYESFGFRQYDKVKFDPSIQQMVTPLFLDLHKQNDHLMINPAKYPIKHFTQWQLANERTHSLLASIG